MFKKLLTILFLIIAAGIFGFGIAVWPLLQPVDSSETEQIYFPVEQSMTTREIGEKLQENHLIKSSTAFLVMVKLMHLDGKIQVGLYLLSPNLSLTQTINKLAKGGIDVYITIPEGKRATEIDAILQNNFPENYRADWKTKLIAHEGYLFPDTYIFSRDTTIEKIISYMTENFDRKYQEVVNVKTVNLTQPQIVTIASIVEREAITPEDMRGVASVLENRLRIGMMLGSDVTVEYALGYNAAEKTWWKKDLNDIDLAIQSPYNTRLYAGLPPTPICNPGLVALEAAANPTKTNYLYFIADKNGKVHFATTLEEHEKNIQKYL